MKIFFIADAFNKKYASLLTTATELGAAVARTIPVYQTGASLSDMQDVIVHSISNATDRDQFMLNPASYDLVIIEPQPELSSYSFGVYPSGAAICAKIVIAQVPVLFLTENLKAKLKRGAFKNYECSHSYPIDQLGEIRTHDIVRAMVDIHRHNRSKNAQFKRDLPTTTDVFIFPTLPVKRSPQADGDDLLPA